MIGQFIWSLFVKKKDHPFELISYSAELLLYGNTYGISGVKDI
jgi:hypothetical protein